MLHEKYDLQYEDVLRNNALDAMKVNTDHDIVYFTTVYNVIIKTTQGLYRVGNGILYPIQRSTINKS